MRFWLRLILSISLLIALSFGIGGACLVSTSFQTALRDEKEAAMHAYQMVRSTLYLLNSLGEKTDYENMADALSQMEQRGAARWQALSLQSEERAVYQSGDRSLFLTDLPRPVSNECVYVVVRGEKGVYLQVLSAILTTEDQLWLQACFDLSPAYEARETQQRLFLVIYLAVVALGVLVAAVLSFALTKKLRRLAAAVRRISRGDLSTRSDIRSPDEFGQLSRDFDAMADKLEENIRKLRADMRRQEYFMGAFAHELKTPMTSIIGYADLLRQDGLDESSRAEAANYIFSEGQRLEKLSFKLLDLLLMEKDALTLKAVSLPALFADLDRAFSPTLRNKGVELVCQAEPGRVLLEPDLIKSLLYNLVDNAAKSMEGGGRILASGRLIPGGCQLQVEDNGCGMEQEELSRITEAFYRVDKSRSRRQGGAGLGLALCRKIVGLHHGSIAFYSEPGQGTCVTIELFTGRGNKRAKG